MKLSEAQKKVIDYLNEGKRIHYVSGLNPFCFYAMPPCKNIHWNTILSLEKLGLIKRTEKYIILTPPPKNK